ncbi:MAG: hypothetical protein HOO91_16905 [Bacteroidales bacterium]|nr:hypothetical protein [Bacteroidales bacterium]
MKKLIIALCVVLLANGCNDDKEGVLEKYFVAEIVSFDMNCQTCILKFPNDSITIKHEIGISRNNYYQTVNMAKDTFEISQKVMVKLRNTKDNELSACITLHPSYDYKNVFIIDFKPYE